MARDRSQRQHTTTKGPRSGESKRESSERRSGGSGGREPRSGSSWNLEPSQQPLANPRWLAGALLSVTALAAFCVYGVICLLFWQGQWQLVFGPSQPVRATPAAAGLRYEDIRFDATETGVLQLDGWWIPAGVGAKYAGDTLLFLRDGSGSLSDSIGQLAALHALGINVFAFDYRGFGSSAKIHPSERSVLEDADAAWKYLVTTRHAPPDTIVIHGTRLGAAVAAETALHDSGAAAVIFEDLQPPVLDRIASDPRTRLLPLHLLFRDRFDPTQALALLKAPKLFLSPPSAGPAEQRVPPYFGIAAEPKTSVVLRPSAAQAAVEPLYGDPSYAAALDYFLSRHLLRSSN
jgi:uncharacterized protein